MQNYKTLRRKHMRKMSRSRLGEEFLDMIAKAQFIKEKIDKIRC